MSNIDSYPISSSLNLHNKETFGSLTGCQVLSGGRQKQISGRLYKYFHLSWPFLLWSSNGLSCLHDPGLNSCHVGLNRRNTKWKRVTLLYRSRTIPNINSRYTSQIQDGSVASNTKKFISDSNISYSSRHEHKRKNKKYIVTTWKGYEIQGR